MNTLTTRESGIPTLATVWNDYQQTRDLKPATIRNYSHRLKNYLHDWLELPVDQITKVMVEIRHREIEGHATANSTFRTLRALLHYAAIKYENSDGAPLLKANPVRRLSELRAWHKDRRRKSVIPMGQIGTFYRAVWSLENVTARDYLVLLLFTGLRSHEAVSLRWEQVDLKNGTILIPDEKAKNGEGNLIPVSSFIWKLLEVRKFGSISDFVFPGKYKNRGYVSNIAKCSQSVKKKTGINFCLHDLRRTFITVADELEIKDGVVKQLVNHKRNDITESYTIRSIERLRRATQLVSNQIALLSHKR